MNARTRSLARIAAVTAATAVVASLVVASPAVAIPADPVIFTASSGTLPLVEPAIGNGTALSVDPTARASLGADILAHTGAFVRVTVAGDDMPVTVFTGDAAAPTPVLSAAAGQAASTTTLLPVLEGTVSLWATTAVDARVELIAGVSGRAATYDDHTLVTQGIPGSIITLAVPAQIANSQSGDGGGALSPTRPARISLTGAGGIDATHVRANLVTVSVRLSEPATLTLDGTPMALPAGPSVFTTIATPDEQGLAEATLSSGEAAFAVWALGWVPDGDDAHTRLSSRGGLQVGTDRTVQQQVPVRAGAAAPIVTDAGADVAYTVALIQASSTGERGALDVGSTVPGRGTGIAVDTVAGAQPQLALVPADASASLVMSRGSALATVTMMGEILGAAVAGGEPTAVSITTHSAEERVDLNEHGFVELGGVLEVGDTALERVEISVEVIDAPTLTVEEGDQLGADGFIGYADVISLDADTTLSWSAKVGAPADGTYRYTAKAYDRTGDYTTASVTLEIEAIIEGDDTVTVNPDALVVNTEAPESPRMTRTDDEKPFVVSFTELPDAVFPGAILVSPIAEGFSDGFLGEVTRIERKEEGWRVTTIAAEMVDVVYDVEHESTTPMVSDPNTDATLEALDEPLVVAASDPESGVEIEEIEVEDDGAGGGALVPREEVSDDPLSDTSRKHVSYQASPGYYVIIGDGEGKENIVVKNTTAYTEAQVDLVRERVINNELPGLFEAFVTVDLDLQVDITTVVDIGVTYKWKYVPVSVTVRELSVNAVADTAVTTELAMNGSVKRKVQLAKPLDKVSLGEFTLWLGPIPVVFKNTITVTVDIELNLQANVHAEDIGFRRTDEVGFQYQGVDSYVYLRKGEMQTLTPRIDGVRAAGTAEINGGVSAGPTVLIASLIYGYVGPQLEFKPRVGAEGALTHTNLIPEGRKIDLHVGVGGGLTGRVFGQLKIWKFSLPFPSKTIVDEHVTFWEKDWSWTLGS